MHLNSVQVIGRVGKKRPDWGYTSSGAATCAFTLEMDEPSKSGEVFTLYLPVEIWGQAERAIELLEPGDEVMLSGQLKYKLHVAVKTQQKVSKLILSSWGVSQRIPSPSTLAQDEHTDRGESDSPSAVEIVQPEGNGERLSSKKGKPRYPKSLGQPWPRGLVSEN